MRRAVIIILAFITALITTPSLAQNRVLSLDGDGDYVEIEDSEALNSIDSQVTMEAWIKATAFSSEWMPIIYKGDKEPTLSSGRSYTLWLNSYNSIHLASAPSGGGQIALNSPPVIALNIWYHIAGVIDAKGGMMKMFINGIEVANRVFGEDIRSSSLPLRIAWTHEEIGGAFAGQIDEVRIWNIARTKEELQSTMHTTLSGKEPGLVGYWRFDDFVLDANRNGVQNDGEQKIATDSSESHADGKLIGDAHIVEVELPKIGELVIPAVFSGMITDETGTPLPNGSIRLEQDSKKIAQTQTDAAGNYWVVVFHPAHGTYDLSATHGEKGDWKVGIRLREGESQTLNLTKEAISIEGTLLMLDDATPHVAVPVEAVIDEKVIALTLSDENGKYRFINLKPGRYQVRCQILGGYVYYGQKESATETADVHVERGVTLKNIDFRFPPFKKGTWKTYTYFDGLPSNAVLAIHCAPDGSMWFGTRGGVSRYDGHQFKNFTTKDGLASDEVFAIYGALDGMLWFGTRNGVSRYDGKQFVNFTAEDGLASNYVSVIQGDLDGAIWFGTGGIDIAGSGVSLYDGKEFVTFTTEDGLANNTVMSIYRAPDGAMWFGGVWDGVSRYDGREFVNFTPKNGLASNQILSIHSGPDGVLWFGTGGGVSRYDGQEFVNFTQKDGLTSNFVGEIYCAPDGVIWLGTGFYGKPGGGVSRYDGKTLINFTTKDGLAHSWVTAIYHAPDGALWFGTDLGGVSRYDEKGFFNLTTKDGLVHNTVRAIHRASNGELWFGTEGGVSQYDGEGFLNLTTKDGLANNQVSSILQAPGGVMWFGTLSEGVSRYDGKKFVNFTRKDGLAHNLVFASHQDPDGVMWFGTWGGVSRYDGDKFTNFTPKDGLPHPGVISIHRSSEDVMWFGTEGGVSRYDGEGFFNLTAKDGLPSNKVVSINSAPDGVIWFGTLVGVSQYAKSNARLRLSARNNARLRLSDGTEFHNFNAEGGLAGNSVVAIHRDADGMWFGTDGGVSRFDDTTWTSLDTRDGLAGNMVWSIHQDADGSLWFGTDGGVTRYRRRAVPPSVRIISVKTDREYTTDTHGEDNLQQAISPVTTGRRVTIKYSAIDFKTVPEKRQYRYRIKEINDDWRPPTKETFFDYAFKKPGIYTFQVQAIDRDLNYSEPASLTLNVVPPWYLNGWIVIPSGGGILALLIWSIVSGLRYSVQRRESQRLRDAMLQQERQSRQELEAKNEQIQVLNEQLTDENLRMAAELEITERIQRMILPSADELRAIAELEIAGYMEPADDVGGDYYDVMQREGMVAISIGDVTGHGLESGLVMLMTQTAVQALLQSGETEPVHLLDTLNRTIYNNVQRIKTDKNLTLCLLDYQSGELKLSGQHEEMIVVRRDGTVELVDTIDLGFPIGLDDDIADFIDQTTVQLHEGDGVVLYTDGITEAENTDAEQYGLERLCEVVSRHRSQSAEAIKEAVIADVRQHIGAQEVYDDITLVVLKQK